MPVIKRGFGGSRLFDSVYWADRLVLVHDPAVIVMFSGTNDLKLLNDGSQPDMQWFDEDELHLNARGYALWTARIKPLVTRLLASAR